jgi:hypothetical protein
VLDLNGIITLNDTGVYVWELLAQQRTLDELTAAVVEHFEVTPEHARLDVQNLLGEITKMGLLKQ